MTAGAFSRLMGILAASLLLGTSAQAEGDAERGRQVYKKCAGCHMVGADARNRSGPPLNNVMDARAAGAAD